MKNWQAVKAEMLQDPKLQAEHNATNPFRAVAMELVRIRLDADLTQQQLADRIGTSKSVVSRLESLDYGRVSLTTLARIADALGLELHIQFLKKAG
jgi:transcriptional regulator with XRE-family HTH domain